MGYAAVIGMWAQLWLLNHEMCDCFVGAAALGSVKYLTGTAWLQLLRATELPPPPPPGGWRGGSHLSRCLQARPGMHAVGKLVFLQDPACRATKGFSAPPQCVSGVSRGLLES